MRLKNRQKKNVLNSKKLLQAILLMLMLIRPMFSQEFQKNKQSLENEFGIDLTKNYSGQEVIELLNIVIEEADTSIANAYQEGYKQAVVELQPDIEYWKLKAEEKTSWKKNLSYMISGFAIGTGLGICITLQFN